MVIFYLILSLSVILITYLCIQDFRKTKQRRVVKEEENNNLFVRPKSNVEIKNDYFNSLVSNYLKKKYPTMLSWEYTKTKNCLQYMLQTNETVIFLKNGEKHVEDICTFSIWDSSPHKQAADETRENLEEENIENEFKSASTEWLVTNGHLIEKAVADAKKEGNGFFAFLSIADATQEFMEELAKTIESNTSYDVTFNEQTLEIGFQNCL